MPESSASGHKRRPPHRNRGTSRRFLSGRCGDLSVVVTSVAMPAVDADRQWPVNRHAAHDAKCRGGGVRHVMDLLVGRSGVRFWPAFANPRPRNAESASSFRLDPKLLDERQPFLDLAFCNAPSASGVCRSRERISTPRSQLARTKRGKKAPAVPSRQRSGCRALAPTARL